MRHDWGCTYFKLDANFWGAIHGGHFHDPAATRIEAYRRAGMTTVVLNPAPPRIWFPLYAGHFPPGTELPEFSFPEFIGSIEACLGVAG